MGVGKGRRVDPGVQDEKEKVMVPRIFGASPQIHGGYGLPLNDTPKPCSTK